MALYVEAPFGMEKLEWRGYRRVKNFEDTFIRYDMIHERDRQIDGHRMTAQTVLCIASHGKN